MVAAQIVQRDLAGRETNDRDAPSTGQEPIAAASLVHDCAKRVKGLCGVGIDPGVSGVGLEHQHPAIARSR